MAVNTEQRVVEIIVKGQKMDASIRDMEAAVAVLNNQLKKLPQGTDAFIKKSEELTGVRQRLKDVKDDVYALEKSGDGLLKNLGGSFSSLGGIIAGGVVAAIGLAVAAVVNFGKEAYELAKKYSDAFADIRKSTGMTADEVKALNDRLGDLDTRTSQLDLLEIAKVGGQIGIAKEQMDAFVESTDKAVVALGDEFSGGAEEVAAQIGGLNRLFKDTRDLAPGEAINKIGSAINELGAAGAANGPFMTDFAQRVAGLGNLSPAISDTLGLGAALQELGETAENAASGTKNVIKTMAVDIPAFAKQVNMGAQEFKKLLDNNPNDALLKLADSFKGMAPTDVIMRLKQLGITSGEAQGVMLKLANNTDFVKEKQLLANKALAEGTSLTNEFNIKNNTAAAIAEKNAKAWEKLQLQFGQGLAPAISAVLEFVTGLIGVFQDLWSEVEPIFAGFFSEIGQLARNLGFATDKGSLLAGILETIGTVLRVLLIPMKLTWTVVTALIGAFNYAYQNSNLFRTAINGMLVPIRLLWEGIKQVIDWLGKLGSLAGKEVKVKTTIETNKKTTNSTTNKSTPTEFTDSGELDKLLAEQEAKEQKVADASAKKAAAAKARKEKEAADAVKLQQKYNDELIKAENDLAAAQMALSEKTNNDKLNKLNQAHQKEIDKLEEKRNAVLNNEKLTEEQKQALYQYHQQELVMEQKFGIDKAEIDKENEEKIQEARNKRDLANADLAIAAAGKNADLLLEAKLAKLEVEKEIELQNKELTEEEKALIEERYAARSEELYNEQAEKKKAKDKEVQNALIDFGRTAIDAIGDFARISTDKKIAQYDREKTQAIKKLDEQLKQGAITKDQYDKAKEATDAEYDKKATAAKLKQAKIDKAVALTQAVISTALAVVKALPNVALSIIAGATGAIGIAKIAATPLPTFAQGGYTGNGIGAADQTGFRPVGIVHENEYVVPKWMTESPKYANVLGYMEAERVRGRGYADGGLATTADTSPTADYVTLMRAMLVEFRELKTEISTWPKVLQVHNNVGDTQDKIAVLNQIKADARL